MSALRNRQKPGKEERQKQRCPLFKAMRANKAVHVTAARLRFGMNVKGHIRAAARDGER